MLKKPLCNYAGEIKELQSTDNISGLENLTNDAQLKRSAADINSFTEKTALVDNDLFLIEDSADSYNKKKVKKSTLGGGSNVRVVYKPTAETVSSNSTYQDDDNIALSIDAGGVYQYELLLMVNHAGGANAGFKAKFIAPSGATAYSHVFRNYNNNSTFYLVNQVNTLVLNGEPGVITGSGDYNVLKATGVVINGSTAGTLQLQWAQYTSTAINTSVMAGSYLKLTKAN
jgi:hypothetical protein